MTLLEAFCLTWNSGEWEPVRYYVAYRDAILRGLRESPDMGQGKKLADKDLATLPGLEDLILLVVLQSIHVLLPRKVSEQFGPRLIRERLLLIDLLDDILRSLPDLLHIIGAKVKLEEDTSASYLAAKQEDPISHVDEDCCEDAVDTIPPSPRMEDDSREQDNEEAQVDEFYTNEFLDIQMSDTITPNPEKKKRGRRGPAGPFSCDQCAEVFHKKCLLASHVRAAHGKRKTQACDLCNFRCYTIFKLHDHQQSAHSSVEEEQELPCHLCQKLFNSSKRLSEHLRRAHGELKEGEEEEHPCQLCTMLFNSSKRLSDHLRRAHGELQDRKNEEEKLSCHLCQRLFSSSKRLSDHMRRAHGELQEGEGFREMEDEEEEEEKKVKVKKKRGGWGKPGPFLCDQCSAVFKKKCLLVTHVRSVHNKEKPYACNLCDFRSFTIYRLRNHQTSLHTEDRFPCDICGQLYRSLNYLREHRRTHTAEPTFACDRCPYKAKVARYLKYHIRFVHEGTQEHACDRCDKRFARTAALREHMRFVHEGVRELPCPQCGRMFGRAHHLRKHLRGVHKIVVSGGGDIDGEAAKKGPKSGEIVNEVGDHSDNDGKD